MFTLSIFGGFLHSLPKFFKNFLSDFKLKILRFLSFFLTKSLFLIAFCVILVFKSKFEPELLEDDLL